MANTVAVLYIDPRGPYPRLALEASRIAAEVCEACGEEYHPNVHCSEVMPKSAVLIERDRSWTTEGLKAQWLVERTLSGPIDCWDAARDARLYDGPHPVVAHPPCKHWSRLRHMAQWACRDCQRRCRLCDTLGDPDEPPACPECGGELTGDWDCAPRAVEQVRRWGGVLEHPAGSLLWQERFFGNARHESECFTELLPPAVRLRSDGPTPIHTDSFGGFTIEVDQVEWGHVARKRTWLYLVGVPLSACEAPPFPGREPTHWCSGGRDYPGRKHRGMAAPPGIKCASAQQRRRTPPLFAEYLLRLARSVSRA